MPKKGFSFQHIVIIYNDLRFSLPEMSQDPKPLLSLLVLTNVLLELPKNTSTCELNMFVNVFESNKSEVYLNLNTNCLNVLNLYFVFECVLNLFWFLVNFCNNKSYFSTNAIYLVTEIYLKESLIFIIN